MNRSALRAGIVALIVLCLGIGGAAAVFSAIPDPGSAPAIYDDFQWSSTANGYWHQNPIGGKAIIAKGILRLTGAWDELDRRIQTDPYRTVAVVKIRGVHFKRFGFGLGIYHAGTLGMEFDIEGIKCGYGSDYGYQVVYIDKFKKHQVPVGKWFYLMVSVSNPYPTAEEWAAAENLPDSKRKKVIFACSAYDSHGNRIAHLVPKDPPPNAHYAGLDEVFLRTWDSGNDYRIDWFYAGPPSGNPLNTVLAEHGHHIT